jgi:hypothetical protein
MNVYERPCAKLSLIFVTFPSLHFSCDLLLCGFMPSELRRDFADRALGDFWRTGVGIICMKMLNDTNLASDHT